MSVVYWIKHKMLILLKHIPINSKIREPNNFTVVSFTLFWYTNLLTDINHFRCHMTTHMSFRWLHCDSFFRSTPDAIKTTAGACNVIIYRSTRGLLLSCLKERHHVSDCTTSDWNIISKWMSNQNKLISLFRSRTCESHRHVCAF